jgi:hypothetical protein
MKTIYIKSLKKWLPYELIKENDKTVIIRIDFPNGIRVIKKRKNQLNKTQ